MDRRRADAGKREQWRKLVADAARSGTSIREYCRQRRVTEAQFYMWRARLNGKAQGVARRRALASGPGTTSTFALVSETAGELDAGIELVLADGCRVRIRRGVDEATLRTVLTAVGTGPC